MIKEPAVNFSAVAIPSKLPERIAEISGLRENLMIIQRAAIVAQDRTISLDMEPNCPIIRGSKIPKKRSKVENKYAVGVEKWKIVRIVWKMSIPLKKIKIPAGIPDKKETNLGESGNHSIIR
jgi:hypothetical protein